MVAKGFGDQFAVASVVLAAFGDETDIDILDIEFFAFAVGMFGNDTVNHFGVRFVIGFINARNIIWWGNGIVARWLINLHGIAVKIRVSK